MRSKLGGRVAEAAEIALATRKLVTALDVLTGLRWLRGRDVDTWRQGRAADLERLAAVDASRMAEAIEHLREWAVGGGLVPGEAAYISAGRDRRPLRFTASGSDELERSFRVQWVSPEMSEAARRRLEERQNRAPDLVAVAPVESWTCAGCGATTRVDAAPAGERAADPAGFMITESDRPYCLTCSDMDHLFFLPSGDAALSRRAKKGSGLSAVVVRFNRRRKRYERLGILVEEAALASAEEQCLADEEVRLRRRERDRERRVGEDVTFQAAMAAEILRLFPGCPPDRAESVAGHAGQRGSGRVGRTAAARVLDENAITLAVVASVRHLDTDYDRLLMSGVPRMEARDRIRSRVEEVLTDWRSAPRR
ncbi:DUF2293 domain-containing protein [Planotetraspora kaengkrachanensis]|uniref:DUF2293 domain-containing protein n=1 Tax=Planotetraspora kaengkrachanensis TaxID=575193 RepID=A0A8J3V705_9ACTN|nr:DUF2293 domain-containing protein [Planotetraspora kaengkrachanensis]GIG81925.1 hypothetical protein Pka01_50520 [Planotetraspora kaengkrachanensis]